VAPATTINHKETKGVAQSGKLHHGKEHRGDSTRPNRCRNITSEQRKRIKELYESGLSGNYIAEKLGLGRTTVYRHLNIGFFQKS